MKQKILAMTLAACMILSLLPVSALAENGDGSPPAAGTGDFTVVGGTLDTDYSFAGNTLTISTSTPLTISGTTTDHIVVSGGTEQNPVQLTLDNVIINTHIDNTPDYSALTLTTGSHAVVTLAGENKFGEGWDSIHAINMVVGNNSTLTFTGSGSLFCCESMGWSKLSIGTGGTVNVQGGTLNLRASYDHNPTVAGGGTFLVDGGTVKLRADGGALFSDNTAVSLASGSMDIYNAANSFGGISLTVSGGQLSSMLTGLTFDPAAFTFNGGVVSLAAGIPDTLKSGADSWNGITLEGNTGTVYGSATLAEDFELTQGQTLTIGSDAALTIPNGVTLTNRGTITNDGGILTNNGALLNYGAISGTVSGTAPVPPSTVMVSFADENGSPLADDTAAYGDTIKIIATMAAKTTDSNVLSRSAAVNTVDFYGNRMEAGSKLGSADVVSNDDGTVTASLTLALTGDAFEKGLGMYSNWIYADFGGGAGLLDASGYGELIVEKGAQTPPSAPVVSAKASASVTLNAVTDTGYGAVQYGYQTAGESEPGHWQADTKFYGLTPDADYSFYARFRGDYYHNEAVSAGCQLTTGAAHAHAPASYCVAERPLQIKKADESHLYALYGDDAYIVSGDSSIVITGSTTEHTVAVRSGCTANITLDGVEIQLEDTTPGVCAFEVESGAVCNLTLTGANTLKSGRSRAGLQVEVKNGIAAELTITAASTGSLSVTGGEYAAGIGGGDSTSDGFVNIAGGIVTAAGGVDGAGIGGGHRGSGGNVKITGGTVTATGGSGGAGIGGGYRGSGGNVTITGGTVTAEGKGGGDGIGTGDTSYGGVLIIDGGSVEASSFTNAPKNSAGVDVYAVQLTVPAGDTVQALAVRNSGPVAYGCPDTVQPSGKLTLYLPAGDYTGTALIGGKLLTLQFTAASGQTATTTPTDTGITVTIPDGGTATITDKGKLKLPGGSTVQVGGGEIVTVPAAGGTVDPADGSVTATPQPSGSSGSSSSRPSASVSGTGGKVSTASGIVTITPEEGYQIGKITVNGKEVDIPEDGKLTGLKSTDKVIVTFEKIPEMPAVDMSKYTDLDAGAWYYEATAFVVERGLFYGTSENSFSPNSPMTRAMLMTVLARADGQDTTAPTGGKWYDVGMSWAVENGISDGTNPEGNISREQLAVMLYRCAGSPAVPNQLLDFTDAGELAPYAQDAMRWAVSEGIVSGKGNGILDPKGNATRAQVAMMLMRYLSK